MPEKITRQYGLWDSPITPRSLAESLRLESAAWDTDGRTLVWLEGRSGRGVLVAEDSPEQAPRDLTTELSVRGEVGYGGGDFTLHGGHVYFAVHKDGRIFRQPLAGGEAKPITPRFGQSAAPVVSPDGRWLAYVHHDEGTDLLAVVDTEGKFWPQIFTSGHDFYMQPRFGPDGRWFCWIAWDHPNMPWDGTTLYLAPLIEAPGRPPTLSEPQVIAGGPQIATFQPEFTPDGRHLLYVSDEEAWGRLAIRDLQSGARRWLTPTEVELGWPAWAQDMRTYAVSHDGRHVVAARTESGFQRIERIEIASGESQPVAALADYTDVATIHAAPEGDRVVFVGSGATIPKRIVEYDFAADRARILARSSGETVGPTALAVFEPVSWPTTGGETAHGLFYPPASDRFEASGKPPLIVLVHGGPTGLARSGWSNDAQFFATRGYAVLYVNYRGSTGYGREYMLKLRGNWGVYDVDDCITAVRHLADAGRIDPGRTVIMGGSAGGFTVLQTMTQHPEAFAAGISLYGVANQFHLASETHKFEERYLDTMLGPLPEAAPIYRERSPEFHADKIRRPLAVFQGEEDRVVPKAQAEAIVAALRKTGTPHLYHCYQGEGHGWRKRETIEHFYKTLEEFLRRHLIFA